jgi:hypothetical protein
LTYQQNPGFRQGNAATHQKKRQRMRRRLRQLGWSETDIERTVTELRWSQTADRDAARSAAKEREATEARLYPDDRNYRVPEIVNNVGRGKRNR